MRDPKPSCWIIPFTGVIFTMRINSTACLDHEDTAKTPPACDFLHVLSSGQISEALPVQASG